MPTLHAFDLLEKPLDNAPPVCVVFGNEPFLKTLVLKQIRWAALKEEDVPYATFDGAAAELRQVLDELSTVALFGGAGKRLAIVDDADDFVSLHRERLEAYVGKPQSGGVLVLLLDSWPANTKLYKAVAATGLAVECNPPLRGKEIDEGRLAKWLPTWAKSAHQITLPAEAARQMLDLVGTELGLLDQELAKLALFAGIGGKVTIEQVRDVVGGWRVNSAWDLADAMAEGNAPLALRQLDKILQSGEKPQALYGQLAWALRRYALAARIVEFEERRGNRVQLSQVIKDAGFRTWEKGKSEAAEAQLKQLTRQRAGKLYGWLLELDLKLKLSHSQEDRGRWALEELILRLSREFAPARPR